MILPKLVQDQFSPNTPFLKERIENSKQALELARIGRLEDHRQNKHEFDQRHKPLAFSEGENVYLKRYSSPKGKNTKLMDKWLPGYKIIRRHKNTDKYWVENEMAKGKNVRKMVDASQLKTFHQRAAEDMPDPLPAETSRIFRAVDPVLSPPTDGTESDDESTQTEQHIAPEFERRTRTRAIKRPTRFLC